MDIVGTLGTSLGLSAEQSQAVAGAVLGVVRTEVAQHVSPQAATQLDAAVPELPLWQRAAATVQAQPQAESGGFLGGLADFAGSGLGNQLLGQIAGKDAQEQAALVGILSKVGLDTTQAMAAAPLLMQFLKARLPPEWIEPALQAAPVLVALASAAKG